MSSSPPRPSSPQGEGGQDSTPENCFGPDSIRAMCDTIGTFLSEEASRELVRTFISLNDLVVLQSLFIPSFRFSLSMLHFGSGSCFKTPVNILNMAKERSSCVKTLTWP